MTKETGEVSIWRTISPRARLSIQVAILVAVAFLLVGGGVGLVAKGVPSTDLASPVTAYSTGGVTISTITLPYFIATVLLTTSAIVIAAYLNGRKFEGDRRSVVWGNWWLLIIIPAILDNYFDGFIGHTIFTLLFVYIAFLFWQGKGNAWKWGSVVGLMASGFYASDGTGDLIRGGVWNQIGITLSSASIAHSLWGLLAFASDLTVAMFLIPLTYSMFRGRRELLTIFLAASVFAVVVPRLVLLPTLGFAQVFDLAPVFDGIPFLLGLVTIGLLMRTSKTE